MDYVYPALFQPEADGGFLVTFPDVPEAITQGDDFADAYQPTRPTTTVAPRPRSPAASRQGKFRQALSASTRLCGSAAR